MNELALLLMYGITSYAFSFIVVYSMLLFQLREFIKKHWEFGGKLVSCILCFSFWAGIALSLLGFSPSSLIIGSIFIGTRLFIDALFASGSTWLIYIFTSDKQVGK